MAGRRRLTRAQRQREERNAQRSSPVEEAVAPEQGGNPAEASPLSELLQEDQLVEAAVEQQNLLGQEELLIRPPGIKLIIDTPILIGLQDCDENREKGNEGPEQATHNGKTYHRPDGLVRHLARSGLIGISYYSLYEALSPKQPGFTKKLESGASRQKKERHYRQFVLNAEQKQQMVNRVKRLKSYPIRVVDVPAAAMRLALDLWFDTRMQRFDKLDPFLGDPIIAATGITAGVPLYSTNSADFSPFGMYAGFRFVPLEQEGHYFRLQDQ